MSIDGEELRGIVVQLPGGMGELEWPSAEPLHRVDRIRISLEVVVTHVKDGAGVDGTAITKEQVKRAYVTALDKGSIEVLDVIRRKLGPAQVAEEIAGAAV